MIRREFVKSMMAAACGLCLPSVNQIITKLDEPRQEFKPGFYEVPLETILVDWSQSIRRYHGNDYELIQSIKEMGGIVQRLTCAPVENDPTHVQLICGFRRYHALATFGVMHPFNRRVPILVGNFSSPIDQLVESYPAREPTKMETAIRVRMLKDAGYTVSYIARMLKESDQWVLRMLSLSTGKV